MQLKGSVSVVNQTKQGTQVTVDVENEGKVVIYTKQTDYSAYTVGQNLTVTVETTPA